MRSSIFIILATTLPQAVYAENHHIEESTARAAVQLSAAAAQYSIQDQNTSALQILRSEGHASELEVLQATKLLKELEAKKSECQRVTEFLKHDIKRIGKVTSNPETSTAKWLVVKLPGLEVASELVGLEILVPVTAEGAKNITLPAVRKIPGIRANAWDQLRKRIPDVTPNGKAAREHQRATLHWKIADSRQRAESFSTPSVWISHGDATFSVEGETLNGDHVLHRIIERQLALEARKTQKRIAKIHIGYHTDLLARLKSIPNACQPGEVDLARQQLSIAKARFNERKNRIASLLSENLGRPVSTHSKNNATASQLFGRPVSQKYLQEAISAVHHRLTAATKEKRVAAQSASRMGDLSHKLAKLADTDEWYRGESANTAIKSRLATAVLSATSDRLVQLQRTFELLDALYADDIRSASDAASFEDRSDWRKTLISLIEAAAESKSRGEVIDLNLQIENRRWQALVELQAEGHGTWKEMTSAEVNVAELAHEQQVHAATQAAYAAVLDPVRTFVNSLKEPKTVPIVTAKQRHSSR